MNAPSGTKTAAVLAALSLAALAPAGAQLASQLGILDLEANGGINPATGNAWQHGDKYRFIFTTSGTTKATSTDIATYNTFVQNAANASHLPIGAADGATWKAIVSTATDAARDNTLTNIAENGPGEAIFLLDGVTLVATDYAALWGASTHNGGISKTELLTDPPKVKQYGDTWTGVYRHAYPDPNYGTASANDELGAVDGTAMCGLWPFNSGTHWIWRWGNSTDTKLPLYALSEPLTVAEPSGPAAFLLSITPAATGYDLTWESQDGMLYNVWSTPDPSEALADWDLVQDTIAATGTSTTWNVTPAEPSLYYRIEEFPPPPVTLLDVDFESGAGGFTAVNHSSGTVWVLGDPDSTGDGGTVATGNGDSANCWGTDIGNPGFHATGTDTSLISPIIDLTGMSATLSFAQAIDILAPGDTLVVNVIDDTTDTVIETAIHTSTPDDDINSADWETVDSIAVAGGEPVRIEWRFTGDGDGSYLGAYIDDVLVTTP